MFKFNIQEQLKAREYAKRYFPNYFNYLIGKSNYSYNEFQSKYIQYLEAYFNDELDGEKRSSIKSAYNYINSICLRDTELSDKESVSGLVHRIWEQYRNLIEQIATYKFDTESENTKEYIQNTVNIQITDQISLFDPLIHDICITINDKIKTEPLTKPHNEHLIDRHLKYRLDYMGKALNDAQNNLFDSQSIYHEAWNNYTNPECIEDQISDSELDIYSNDWRKARNKACQTILSFVGGMVELNLIAFYNAIDYKNTKQELDEETLQKINYYNACLKYLQHSSNYYCYLDDTEKEKLALQKTLKKEKLTPQ